eukprot:TRINITY_DN61674_c0_g1_i1.p1 TRINITY_DN61674_c0_g1~~TRINITY_DN61674_c0_g1_i1.p1  ORF type:complete len:100 (+),score=5.20 TRINITY_DN61674_c0_g1_i1:43-342(+)
MVASNESALWTLANCFAAFSFGQESRTRHDLLTWVRLPKRPNVSRIAVQMLCTPNCSSIAPRADQPGRQKTNHTKATFHRAGKISSGFETAILTATCRL